MSQPLLRQPPAEAERAVSIELAIRAVETTRKTSSARTESRRFIYGGLLDVAAAAAPE